MNKFDRIQQLHGVLSGRRTPVSLADLADRLECSEPTVKRLIAKFRYEFDAPVTYNRNLNGYILDTEDSSKYELPGLWFSLSELHSLLVIHELLDRLQQGMLKAELAPFRERISRILSANNILENDLPKRFKLYNVAARVLPTKNFGSAATATLSRKCLKIQYHSRSADRLTTREVSPQRIVYYRENWYLDCWCHLKKELRTFSLDRMRKIEILKTAAEEIPDEDLDQYYSPAYGLFGGAPSATAVLKFTPERARWVASEKWHPEQRGEWLTDGSYILHLPYSDHRELTLDILRFGPDVEVIEPEALRKEVKYRLQNALEQYQ